MTIAIGFSIVAAGLLVLAYLAGHWIPKRTPFSIVACMLLSGALIVIQLAHLSYLQTGSEPLAQPAYRLMVFVAPALFFYFGRALVLPEAPITPVLAIHLLPPLIAWALPAPWNLALILGFGTGYALWLSWLVLTARSDYRQRRFERLFSALITLFALTVLASGLLITGSPEWFYHLYALSISLTYALILFALVAIPDFVTELFERTQHRYVVSTLGDTPVAEKLAELARLMQEDRLYREENLSLASLAEALGLSHHQLSELLNQHLNQSYSQFVRQHRLKEAATLLRDAPEQSVLSIALQTGFRSQSTFYTAFRDVHGCTPGAYRKAQGRAETPE